MNKQIVYIPTIKSTATLQVGNITKAFYEDFEKISDVEEKEGYFFTPEELKQFLQDYTDRIVENAKAESWNDQDGLHQEINEESITSQLEPFLKERL